MDKGKVVITYPQLFQPHVEAGVEKVCLGVLSDMQSAPEPGRQGPAGSGGVCSSDSDLPHGGTGL